MFVNTINCFRKTKPFKILGFLSLVLVPIMAMLSTDSLSYFRNGFVDIFTAIIQVLWINILFPILFFILITMYIIFTSLGINSIKTDKIVKNTNIIADIGYLICTIYLIYCLVFYIVIVPTSLSPINKGIDYINENSKNFVNLGNNMDNLCITYRKNALNCFVKNINGGHIDKEYEGDAILTFDRIYYFHPTFVKDKTSNKLLLKQADVFVSDRLKIVAPVEIAQIYNDYFYKKDKKIKLYIQKIK